ncbi:hypothetical protein SLEP1_g30095 [Rubroshorea leprosula]|uniref:Proliferating cell nuclear antigen n=1 Tax=Rubroshorea leprosula TaxID=152421 RepID=A0AAV5JZ00_9ROSI|nr:hypothetical protein SLEP1_g30095 [Rubroshorea leprosula]
MNVSGNAKPVKKEVIVIDEEPVVNSTRKTQKRSNPAANSSKSKNVKVKKEEPQDLHGHTVKKEESAKKEESGDPDKTGFTLELNSHAAFGLRNALRAIRIPKIYRSNLEAKPSQLQIQIKNLDGSFKALLTLKPDACTVFNCTQSYMLGLEFDRLLAAICNPAQDDQSIIRLSIGDRKLPLIIQSGTNSTTFEVELQSLVSSANAPAVYASIFLSSGFFNCILHSMEEMVAYKVSLGNQLDINNLGIDIEITSKAVKITAVGVGYHLNPQQFSLP